MTQHWFVILDRDGRVLADRDTGEQFFFPSRADADRFVIEAKGERVKPAQRGEGRA